MDKVLEISLLYDFYSQMLTDKQKNVLELYYNDDLSLGEISETLSISRQAVFDLLKHGEKLLHYYEDKLKLVDKFVRQREKLEDIYILLDSIESEKADKIKLMIRELIELDI